MLKVRIEKIVPRASTTSTFRACSASSRTNTRKAGSSILYLDLEQAWRPSSPRASIPLEPFPGTIAVARAEPGQYSSVPPGRYGGNIDFATWSRALALRAGVREGRVLWTGDSHAAQGNGEVNLTALETAYKEMNVTVEVMKGRSSNGRASKRGTLDHRGHRPRPEQGARDPGRAKRRNSSMSSASSLDGATTHDERLGLPRHPGGRCQQGHALLHAEERQHATRDRTLPAGDSNSLTR